LPRTTLTASEPKAIRNGRYLRPSIIPSRLTTSRIAPTASFGFPGCFPSVSACRFESSSAIASYAGIELIDRPVLRLGSRMPVRNWPSTMIKVSRPRWAVSFCKHSAAPDHYLSYRRCLESFRYRPTYLPMQIWSWSRALQRRSRATPICCS
jgi:hypothetical protein